MIKLAFKKRASIMSTFIYYKYMQTLTLILQFVQHSVIPVSSSFLKKPMFILFTNKTKKYVCLVPSVIKYSCTDKYE